MNTINFDPDDINHTIKKKKFSRVGLKDGFEKESEDLKTEDKALIPCEFKLVKEGDPRKENIDVLKIDTELKEKIQVLGSKWEVSPLITLLIALKIMFYRYGDEGKLLVEIQGADPQKACENNILSVLSLEEGSILIGSETCMDILEKVKTDLRKACGAGDNSFGELVFDNFGTDVDLKFVFKTDQKGMQESQLWSAELSEKQPINKIKNHLLQVLRSIIKDPNISVDHLSMLTKAEEQQLLVTFNDTSKPFPKDLTIVDLFVKQVQKTPEATAIMLGDEKLSFRELDARSNQLAHYLRSKGVKEESMVPICMERSLEMVIGIIGILKAGGAYIPIDPEYPLERINFILKEAHAFLVVTNKSCGSLIADTELLEVLEWEDNQEIINLEREDRPQSKLTSHHLAYVIFTSGSTGKPKGVLIEHAQLVSSTLARNSYYKNLSSILLIPSFSFDASVAAIFGSITSGNCLILSSEESIKIPKQLEVLLKQTDTILCIPSYYKFLLEEGLIDNSRLSKVIVGGESLDQEVVNAHFNHTKGISLFNEYGPTEATVWSTVSKIDAKDKQITIGSPIANTQVHILDSKGGLVPLEAPGELHIAGEGIARGYLNRPDLTSEKFINNPYDKKPGSKMYKTGDLGYWLPNGTIAYVGRLDDQVKIQGHRIELGEIEAILLQSDKLKQAVVTSHTLQNGIKQLVAYVIAKEKFEQQEIVNFLKNELPAYMIPSLWVEMQQFPITANGKIDKQALPQPQLNKHSENEYVGPVDPLEVAMVDIWKKFLSLDRIGIHDNFFEIGGNSLLAMRVISTVRKDLKLELGIKEFFHHSTIAKLVAQYNPSSPAGILPPIQQVTSRPNHIPLSYSQESLWLIDQMEGSESYHLPIVLKIEGKLDFESLEKSLKSLVARHEVLRTVIRMNDDGLTEQYPLDPESWTLSIIEGREIQSKEEMLQRVLQNIIIEPFDLSTDYMLRASLIRLVPDEYLLIFVLHHIAFDAWSNSVFLKDFLRLYKNNVDNKFSFIPSLPVQYSDYAIWQKEYIGEKYLEKKSAYWKDKLDGVEQLHLPTDHLRSSDLSTAGAVSHFSIDQKLSKEVRALALKEGATFFMILLAAFKVLLYRYSSQEDICVGTAVAGRPSVETEDLIGYFINTLALRSQVDGKIPFTRFLEQVKTTTLEAYDHQDVPFEKVVAAVGADRVKNQNPLFQVMFLLQNIPEVPALEMEGAKLSLMEMPQHTSKFELTFSISETSAGLNGVVEYRTDLYSEQTIDKMIGHYHELLHSLVKDPEISLGKLPMLTSEERHKLLITYNDTALPFPKDKTIVDLLKEQVVRNPEGQAILFGEQSLSYQQLHERSNQLAHLLLSKGVKEETLVLICIERSLEMVVGILGILKSGAAYVPIDPEYPRERIKFIQEDTAANIVVTNKANQSKLQDLSHLEIINLDWKDSLLPMQSIGKVNIAINPQQLAYVIYTSGSTGTPKGVMLEHGNLQAFIGWCRKEFESSHFDMVYASTSICFDLSIFEILFPLTIGKPIRILENGLKIGLHLAEDSYVLINTVPSVVQHLIDEGVDLSHVSVINMAGESISEKIIEKLDPELIEVRNLYGPTEDTTYSTVYKFDKAKTILIGKPIGNSRIYISSNDDELTPEGVPGEICISGAGLARGYFNRKDLSAEKFVPNPYSNDSFSRMYRTGDLGRWVKGEIEFLGRKDDQVKIRGYRIELGEIDRVLQQYEGIKVAVILAKADSRGEKQLVGYAVLNEGFNQSGVIDFLKRKLPAYMIPALWVWLDALPLTPNGKINRKALPHPEPTGGSEDGFIAPRNGTERELAQIWKNLLGLKRVSIHDNFFDLGGHSLLATRLISAIRKQLGVELGIKDLFTFPTIAGLSAQLQQLKNNSWTLPPIQKAEFRPEPLPLSYSQESLWFIDQLEGSVQYHLPVVLRLNGVLDNEALDHALRMILERHEVLRTVIINTEGKPSQKVMDPADWHLTLFEGKDFEHTPKELQKHIESIIIQPFDLARDYMLRASLVRLNPQDHVLVLTMHHIAFDGWSIPIVIKELIAFYSGGLENRAPAVLPLPVQYSDFALWQRNNLKGEFFDKKSGFWKEKLQGLMPLQLPTDNPRPEVRSNKGALRTFSIEGKIRDRLLLLGQKEGTTLFMTLLAAFKVLLYRYSNREDICVGTASAGRQHQETEGLIGYFVNPLPIRSTVEGEALFSALLQKVKTNSLEAFDNQEVPFEKIVAAVSSYRDFGKNPLFQVMFVLQNLPETTAVESGQLKITQEAVSQTTSKFDLTFILSETPGGVQGAVEYSTDLYREDTIDQLVKEYVRLLQVIALDPDQKIKDMEFLMEDKDRLFPQQDFDPVPDLPEFLPVHSLIGEAARKFGEKTAVFFGGEKCSYTELNRRANQLAHCLIQKGLVPGGITGIFMDRSIDMVVAVLGILKAGGAYLPIDTDYPSGRAEYMLRDSSGIHITQKEYRNKFSSGSTETIWEDFVRDKELYPGTDPAITTNPGDAAYIIYTSGSTGRPKGVIIEHRNLFNFLVTASRTPGITQDDRFLAVSSVSFDIAILEMLLPYVHGAQSFILDKYQRKDPQAILEVAKKESISVMFATPTHWKMILDSGWEKPLPGFNIISGGETLTNDLADRLLPLGKSLWNIYGPTETTVFSTIKEIKNPGELITVGKPVLNTHIYILDGNLDPVRIGEEGEIFISGSGVARGYLNQPGLTEEKFLPDPFHPAGDRRMYRTGDRGKYLPGGEIVILGRKDHQVKLRGYRIELGEIEHALARLDRVREGIVAVKETGPGNPRLVAYLLLSGGEAGTTNRKGPEGLMDRDLRACRPTPGELKDWKRQLAVFLPPFMVPTDFVVMENFPLTASGKIDRNMLPQPPTRPVDASLDLFLAETPEEKLVAGIWCEALGIPQVDITDNFFELGGHSLIAVQVMTRLEKESGIKLPLSILFKYPTVQKLALALQSKDPGAREWDSLVPIKPHGHKSPLYIVHGGGLNVLPFYTIAKNMDPGQPVYGLQAKGLDGMEEPLKSVEDIASHYISEILRHNPDGPYALAGYSLGGIIAFEIAKQLKMSGKTVKELIMFDTYVFQPDLDKNWMSNAIKQIKYNINKRLFDLYLLRKYPLLLKRLKWESMDRRLTKFLLKLKLRKQKPETPIMQAIKNIENIQKEAGKKYILTYYDGPIHLLRAKIPTIYFHDPKYLGWKPFVKEVQIWDMEGEHTTMFSPPNDVNFGRVMQKILDSYKP